MVTTTLDNLTDADIAHYRTFGFLVARHSFDAQDLSDEVDSAFADGLAVASSTSAQAGIDFGYLPMMCERTTTSVELLDRFSEPARRLLGRDVFPVRAKAVRYRGASVWHRDSELPLASVGFVAYLEPLDAAGGALRVLPGSHHPSYGTAVARHLAQSTEPRAVASDDGFAGMPLETRPGDVIVFDEHLYHASHGGGVRRQWRVDFVASPTDDAETATARSYLAGIYASGASGLYDAERYPTYGTYWRARPNGWHHDLERLGAYDAARGQ